MLKKMRFHLWINIFVTAKTPFFGQSIKETMVLNKSSKILRRTSGVMTFTIGNDVTVPSVSVGHVNTCESPLPPPFQNHHPTPAPNTSSVNNN